MSKSGLRAVHKVLIGGLAVITVTVGCIVLLWEKTVNFDEVMKKVKAAECVSYRGSIDDGFERRSVQGWFSKSGIARQVGDSGGAITVIDTGTSKVVAISPVSHRALVVQKASIPGSDPVSLLSELRGLDVTQVRSSGSRDIDGRRAYRFSLETSDVCFDVWADPVSSLPVRLEKHFAKTDILPSQTTIVSDLDWNAKIDDTLMTLPPADCTTVRSVESLDELVAPLGRQRKPSTKP